MRGPILALCALVDVCAATIPTQAAVGYSRTYIAAMTQHPLSLDAAITDSDWSRGKITDGSGSFQNLTTRSPAPLETVAYVLYDDRNLYVAFKARQPRLRITANQTTNNVGFGLDDFVGIGIDTSGNGATVYYFETTPRGTRYQQASESTRYNPVWSAAVRVDTDAWAAVLTIPLKALHRSSAATQTWRFNFIRGVAATGEHYTWAYDGTMQDAAVPAWPNFSDAQFWPRLSGIRLTGIAGETFRDRARADVYVLGSGGAGRTLFAQSNGTFAPQAARLTGVDVSYALTDTIHLVATLNPDFSNVEVDQQTIAPQEFRRPLLEYRPFFAQGANFLNPNSPSAGASQPNNQLFYSPAIGPFDRGMKVEGSFGNQSFGILSFRGYDETNGNVFDDVAYGYMHALPDQSFSYWSDGVIAHHSLSGSDMAAEAGAQYHDIHTGLTSGLDEAFEHGSYVPSPGHAGQFNAWELLRKTGYEAFIDYGDVTPNYNPIDGFTSLSDTRGFVYSVLAKGASRLLKNYRVVVAGDRFLDNSGAVHQSDALATLAATFKDQISLSLGPRDGTLRSYTTSAPGAAGCGDSALVRTAYTGFPNYYCGQTDRFDQLVARIGYRDGTQWPADLAYAQGPFGGTFLRQYSLSASRPMGSKFSIAAQFAGTTGRTISDGSLNSQWLRLISLGENLGPDSNIALELRSVSGLVNGLTAVPGVNFAASYHSKFASGNELYVTFGTPAATQTLNRFLIKYVLHAGTQN